MRRVYTRLNAARIGYAALVVIVVLFGLHCRKIMVTLSRAADRDTQTAGAAGRAGVSPAQILAQRDSVVEASVPGRRDPFRPPPAAPAPRVSAAVVERATDLPKPDPTLGVLLYDRVSPQVQLRVGPRTSGWLRAGESFEDWTVAQIGPTSVKVTNGSRVLELSSR